MDTNVKNCDGYDGVELEDIEIKSRKTSLGEGTKYVSVSSSRSLDSYLTEVLVLSKPKLLKRFLYFAALFVVLTFVLYGQSDGRKFYGVDNSNWYLFFLAIMLVDIVSATVDGLIAFSIDKFWFSYTENAIVVNTIWLHPSRWAIGRK